jgi:hypothetical protein
MEEWKTIKGFDNYEVSNFGNVRSKDRIAKRNDYDAKLSGQMLKPNVIKGYLRVTLYNGTRNKHKQFFIHRLVADAFISNPNDLPFINHKDENKMNNHVDNLEWCTAKYNSNYGTAIERRVRHQNWRDIAKKQSVAVVQKDLNGNVIKYYESMSDAEKYGFNIPGVSKCCNGYLKTYKGYVWEKVI